LLDGTYKTYKLIVDEDVILGTFIMASYRQYRIIILQEKDTTNYYVLFREGMKIGMTYETIDANFKPIIDIISKYVPNNEHLYLLGHSMGAIFIQYLLHSRFLQINTSKYNIHTRISGAEFNIKSPENLFDYKSLNLAEWNVDVLVIDCWGDDEDEIDEFKATIVPMITELKTEQLKNTYIGIVNSNTSDATKLVNATDALAISTVGSESRSHLHYLTKIFEFISSELRHHVKTPILVEGGARKIKRKKSFKKIFSKRVNKRAYKRKRKNSKKKH
jgi:hypothetical protein